MLLSHKWFRVFNWFKDFRNFQHFKQQDLNYYCHKAKSKHPLESIVPMSWRRVLFCLLQRIAISCYKRTKYNNCRSLCGLIITRRLLLFMMRSRVLEVISLLFVWSTLITMLALLVSSRILFYLDSA